jgi:hypothetical protein
LFLFLKELKRKRKRKNKKKARKMKSNFLNLKVSFPALLGNLWLTLMWFVSSYVIFLSTYNHPQNVLWKVHSLLIGESLLLGHYSCKLRAKVSRCSGPLPRLSLT